MKPYNVLEDLIRITLYEYKDSLGLECTCEKCLTDVMALALNQLPPQYVVNQEGNAYIKAKYMDDQNKTNILCAIARAANVVRSNIRHV